MGSTLVVTDLPQWQEAALIINDVRGSSRNNGVYTRKQQEQQQCVSGACVQYRNMDEMSVEIRVKRRAAGVVSGRDRKCPAVTAVIDNFFSFLIFKLG